MFKKKFREIRIKDQVWIHKNTIKDEKKNENLNLDPSFGIHNCMSVPGPSPNCFCLCCLAKAHSICFCSRISFIKSWSSMLHLLLPWREIPALKGSCLFWGKKLKKKKKQWKICKMLFLMLQKNPGMLSLSASSWRWGSWKHLWLTHMFRAVKTMAVFDSLWL